MNKGFVFEIGDLVHKDQGSRRKEELDTENTLEIEDTKPLTRIKAGLTFMKIQGGLHVFIEDLKVNFEVVCSRCAEKFTQKISIDEIERVFNFEETFTNEDEMDRYFVDMKSATIDLSELIRQEIILHFPMIPVCLSGCKGLCQICGQNLNEKNCGCAAKSNDDKPLSIINKLIKE